jgi:hypothetical protein
VFLHQNWQFALQIVTLSLHLVNTIFWSSSVLWGITSVLSAAWFLLQHVLPIPEIRRPTKIKIGRSAGYLFDKNRTNEIYNPSDDRTRQIKYIF